MVVYVVRASISIVLVLVPVFTYAWKAVRWPQRRQQPQTTEVFRTQLIVTRKGGRVTTPFRHVVCPVKK